MATIGLVTVLYNSNDVLEGFFKSLSIQSFLDYELYLIDNSPSRETDDLIDNLVERYPIARYIHVKNEKNNGVAKGNNQGIRLALDNGAQFVLLLNNDIEFYQVSLLNNILNCAVNKGEHIVIPKIYFYGTRIIWMAGGYFSRLKAVCFHIGENQKDSAKYNDYNHYNYAPTCFMLINKVVFDKVGLMDEKYFVYYDDTDFLYRAFEKGYKIFYDYSLEIFHKVSFSTGGKESLFAIYYGNRNRIYFIKKNLNFIFSMISILYTLFTRVIKCVIYYNKEQRKQVFLGIKAGFDL